MGGAEDEYIFGMFGGGNERDTWTTSATTAYPGAYLYNDVKNTDEMVTVLAQFPPGSVSRLVVGGHGTIEEEVGVQPTNNNTERPTGYDNINSETIRNLSEARRNTLKGSLAVGATFEFNSCGQENETRHANAKALATSLGCNVRYAVGGVDTWNQTQPTSEKYDGVPATGKWWVAP
jgi:hypothetical protein